MTNSVGDDSRHSPGADGGPAKEPDVVPERQPGIRNQTLNQLIFLKRRLVIEFISDKNDTGVGRWWMTVGEDEVTEAAADRIFGDYLHDEVTADDVKEILESYNGCGKRKAYDYLNTLRALESRGKAK